MARDDMSGTQRFFTRFVDAETAAAMEAHSRAWLVRCRTCNHARSIWDLGGIRYKAVGNALTVMKCPVCGKRTTHRLEKADNFPVTNAPALPLVRMIVVVTLAILLVCAAVTLLILWSLGVL